MLFLFNKFMNIIILTNVFVKKHYVISNTIILFAMQKILKKQEKFILKKYVYDNCCKTERLKYL
jgi:hypothetical protein